MLEPNMARRSQGTVGPQEGVSGWSERGGSKSIVHDAFFLLQFFPLSLFLVGGKGVRRLLEEGR